MQCRKGEPSRRGQENSVAIHIETYRNPEHGFQKICERGQKFRFLTEFGGEFQVNSIKTSKRMPWHRLRGPYQHVPKIPNFQNKTDNYRRLLCGPAITMYRTTRVKTNLPACKITAKASFEFRRKRAHVNFSRGIGIGGQQKPNPASQQLPKHLRSCDLSDKFENIRPKKQRCGRCS